MHDEDCVSVQMDSRKVAHHRINRDLSVMTCPSYHSTICTVPSIRHRNRTGASTRVIPTMGTETAVVKTDGWSL